MTPPTRTSNAPRAASFTPLQGQYLAFIHTYQGIHGCAPAEADLQRHFAVTPPSVHQMIVTLERKGLIARAPGVARSISLRVPADALPPLEPLARSGSNRHTSQRSAIRSRKAADRAERIARSLPEIGRTRLAKGDLRAAWEKNPESLADVTAFLQNLESLEKAELIEMIGKLVLEFPHTLGLFGFAEFAEAGEDDVADELTE